MHFEFDATFFAFVALVIFLGLMVWLKVPGQIGKALDARADKIKADLEDARRLRQEASDLLESFKRRRKEAEKEAADMVAAARAEADQLKKDAAAKTAEFVARRTAMAEQKIAQAQAQALAEVKASAVDLAIAAAGKLMGDKATGKVAQDLFAKSISEVKSRLN
jgi:F-type H+-transporting ATPase subunit b